MSITDIKAKLGSIKAAVGNLEEIVDRAVASAEVGGFKRIDDAGGQAIYNELRIRCFMPHQMADFATDVVLSLIRKGEAPGLSIDSQGLASEVAERDKQLAALRFKVDILTREKSDALRAKAQADKNWSDTFNGAAAVRDAATASPPNLPMSVPPSPTDQGATEAENRRLAAELAALKARKVKLPALKPNEHNYTIEGTAAGQYNDGIRACVDAIRAAGLEVEP